MKQSAGSSGQRLCCATRQANGMRRQQPIDIAYCEGAAAARLCGGGPRCSLLVIMMMAVLPVIIGCTSRHHDHRRTHMLSLHKSHTLLFIEPAKIIHRKCGINDQFGGPLQRLIERAVMISGMLFALLPHSAVLPLFLRCCCRVRRIMPRLCRLINESECGDYKDYSKYESSPSVCPCVHRSFL